MKKKLNLIRMILLLVLSMQLLSCAGTYKHITYKKSPVVGKTMEKVIFESKMKAGKGSTIFVHSRDSIIQLKNIELYNSNNRREIIGSKTELETKKINVYNYMKKYPEGSFADERKKDIYVKQTHFYVDSLSIKNEKIIVTENQITEVEMYYGKKNFSGVFVAIGVLTLSAIILFAAFLNSGGFV